VFVGQSVYFRQCALTIAAGGLDPSFVDFRAGARPAPLLAVLQQLDPDVVIVFRPEIIPAGLFASLRAVTIGYLTEPLPRDGAGHPDLRERMRWLEQVDPANFDRIVSFDPLIAETAGRVVAVWRSLPLPVTDSHFMTVRERDRPPRLLFVGRSTDHRERLLEPIKRSSRRIVHIGHGLHGDELERLLRWADVQLNLHNNPYPTFENRVSIALAAGHLMITEPLSPRHGLRAGHDYLEASDPEGFAALSAELADDPGAYLDVQAAGRESAERFRASRVYPELISDALADIAASGSAREKRTAQLSAV
jgi:hypothetical protein